MATVLRTMALGQNFHMLPNNCVIVSSSAMPSNAGLHTAGKRPIAPAPSEPRSVRLITGPTGDLKGGKKRMTYSHLSPYPGPPPSVERRNARERNRVKQVNNGFDKLRQHIPQKIVEVENGGRGASKKLSKVDTLKLAVKYIQGLQSLLEENSVHETSSSQGSGSYYAGSPVQSLQESQPPCSEASASPTPSYNSDVSVGHTYNVTSTPYQEPYHAYGMHFEDESASFEEEVLLDDILHWQLQH
ncbi:achaete-scute complex protein T3-like [Lutzomyia longipalpis]|uniref:achaete-scute complex protein T3-like n=1 Tax=Lutzomyia longipalpis TaxID=7200 RepID=UPI0024840308|nr:achaete-scute complex protein T3-like [Lutzomyia longipalpis]